MGLNESCLTQSLSVDTPEFRCLEFISIEIMCELKSSASGKW